jgi:ATP-dependent helicase/nuclease subunit A
MNDNLRERVVATFGLTTDQQDAALERNRDVVVTAGAGSGKTRTLVARYASLLADGLSPRNVVAITFSDKAALEMRSRVRQAINDLLRKANTEEERHRWQELNAKMDSARIGTIHSLCSEILRAHPVEAVIDPKYSVLNEGLTAAMKAEVVEDTLTQLVSLPEFADLFSIFEIKALKELLAYLLNHRLDAGEIFNKNINTAEVIRSFINKSMRDPIISDCISELCSMERSDLVRDAGEALAQQVTDLLAIWKDAEIALSEGDVIACCESLYRVRRETMGGRAGSKNSQVKMVVTELKEAFDLLLNPITGGKTPSDEPPNMDSEAKFEQASQLIPPAFELLSNTYKEALNQRRALDFDDLENGAAQLFQRTEIREKWRGEVAALLVDEFQDTNERQRQIVEALAAGPGSLFVVGDARQSIYRFRRADVTVFRRVQQDIKSRGGLVIDLDRTYRAHEPLLDATGDLLQEIMDTEEDPSRPYVVPFTALVADRKTPPKYISHPHIEILLGAGADAASSRPVAAKVLANRLHELKEQGQIRSWDEVTLLFRATTGYAAYENAFEQAGIPFVTVSGRGFYDRPEIRDTLNILRAIADPADDLAMAGLLRSPAFGLTDAGLYQLRWQQEKVIPYWTALQGDLSGLDCQDQLLAIRALAILKELLPQVDRIPVAELLKKVVDATDYRAILAVEDGSGTGGRLWRNLDKLLGDAQTSDQVNVRDFLNYLVTLNDAGAREGEAPAEAQGSVRLMTIHKSKGLEFPVVVLADTSRKPGGRKGSIYLMQELGLAFKLDPEPLLFRLAKWQDELQDEAETHRLLYVALTRAKDKLMISGHTTATIKGEWSTTGWTGALCGAASVDMSTLVEQGVDGMEISTRSGQTLHALALTTVTSGRVNNQTIGKESGKEPDVVPLYHSLAETKDPDLTDIDKVSNDIPNYRVTGSIKGIPAKVIGNMVHKAIELWLFPDDPRLMPLLETAAQNAGIVQPAQRAVAIQQAFKLLTRLQDHPLREEIEKAVELHHEVPYTRMVNGYAETGYLDLLYLTSAGWQIVDFKTDSIRTTEARANLVGIYTGQMRRYTDVVRALIGQQAHARVCFLDDHTEISLVEVY